MLQKLIDLLHYLWFQCSSLLSPTLCYFYNVSHSQFKMKSFMTSVIFLTKIHKNFRQRETACLSSAEIFPFYQNTHLCFFTKFAIPRHLELLHFPQTNRFSAVYLFAQDQNQKNFPQSLIILQTV